MSLAIIEREKIRKLLTFYDRQFVIKNFDQFSTIIVPTTKLDIIKGDPKDNKFLECAVAANANYIISGDDHLLALKEFQGIKILSPAEFLNIYTMKSDIDNLVDYVPRFSKLAIRDLGTKCNSIILNLFNSN